LIFDEWFEGKKKIEYDKDKLDHLPPHEQYVRKTEGRIMEVISAHRDSGIAHLRLAHIVNIDRKNLTPYMKRLRRKGLVKREKGKQGKYYPTTKGNRGTSITADIFSKAAAGMILANKDFPMDSPFLRNIVTDNTLEDALFRFSNKIGAIITYFLIQSMNPANKIMGNTKNDEEKDLNVRRWIDDAISSLQPVLLRLFKELIGSFVTSLYDDVINSDGSVNYDRVGLNVLSYDYDRPLYTLKEKFISELMSGFSKSYPSITNRLEYIRSQLPRVVPRVVAEEISHWEYRSYCSRLQKNCKHEYKPPLNKELAVKSNSRILHCRKCHGTKFKQSLFQRRS
jgi:predicted transcriptional regulator